MGPPYRLLLLVLYQHLFAQNFRLEFWVGVAKPQSWGRGGCKGSEMVPFIFIRHEGSNIRTDYYTR